MQMLLGLFSHYFFGISIFLTSVFLVLLVLVQRGRGGGLVGALGGPGGQSALGTKAGDVFTRITIVVAAIWIFLCAAAVRTLNPSSPAGPASLQGITTTVSDVGGDNAGKKDTEANSGAGAGSAAPPVTTTPPAASTPAAPSTGATPATATPATATPAAPDTPAPATPPAPATGEGAKAPAASEPAPTTPTTPAEPTTPPAAEATPAPPPAGEPAPSTPPAEPPK